MGGKTADLKLNRAFGSTIQPAALFRFSRSLLVDSLSTVRSFIPPPPAHGVTLAHRAQARPLSWSPPYRHVPVDCARMEHRQERSQIRASAAQRGLRTSGNSAELSALNESSDAGAGVPSSRQSKQGHQTDVASKYAQLLEGVTLAQLGQAFPEESWQHVLRSGWATLPLHLPLADKRFLRVCLHTNLADLGVNPERADTYASAQGDRSYDSGHGWLRRPAFTPCVAC